MKQTIETSLLRQLPSETSAAVKRLPVETGGVVSDAISHPNGRGPRRLETGVSPAVGPETKGGGATETKRHRRQLAINEGTQETTAIVERDAGRKDGKTGVTRPDG